MSIFHKIHIHAFSILMSSSIALSSGTSLNSNTMLTTANPVSTNDARSTCIENSLFQHIATSYLPSFPVIQEPPQKSSDSKKNNQFTRPLISDYERRKLCFELFTKLPMNQRRVGNKNLWKDLEVFCGHTDPHNNLISKVNRTRTVFGEIVLSSWIGQGGALGEEFVDRHELEQRQQVIKQLLADEKMFKELDDALQKIHTAEQALLLYWQPTNPIEQEQIKKQYFPRFFESQHAPKKISQLNTNSGALQAKRVLSHIFSLTSASGIIGQALIGTTLHYLAEESPTFNNAIKSGCIAAKDNFSYLKKCINFQRTPALDLSLVSQKDLIEHLPTSTLGDFLHLFSSRPSIKTALITSIPPLMLVLNFLRIKGRVENTLATARITKYIHQQLIGIATIIEQTDIIRKVLSRNNVQCPEVFLLNELWLQKEAQTLLPMESKKIHHLIDLLTTKTFKGEASFFPLSGRIFAAHKLLQEVKDELSSTLYALGAIDAYLSIATLYQEKKANKEACSFATFIDRDRPCIRLTGFWNPFLESKSVILNNIYLGDDNNPQNVILTGPNTGGKSTVIKAVAINILLAQSLGIVMAEEAQLTIFDKINSYLYIFDDTAGGNSLFKAEVIRSKELLETIRSLKHKNKFCFTVMDELFSGTTPREGEEAAYIYARELAKNNNNIYSRIVKFENSQKQR